MNYIAVDTSGAHLTLLIKNGEKVYEFYDENCAAQHSVRVMEELENLLLKANMRLEDADFFACVVGAGSFTGIRIGVSTVKALAFANGKPVLSITSFDTIAYNIDSEKVLALIDAKHDGFYACPYIAGVSGKAEYVTKGELVKFDGFVFASGEKINGLETEVVSVLAGLKRAIEKKQGEISADINSLTPLYVRKSQAEEGR